MRTIVDIPENDIKALDSLGKKENISRAGLVRQAVSDLLDKKKRKQAGEIIGPDIRGTVKEGDPRYFKGMSTEDWIREMRGENRR